MCQRLSWFLLIVGVLFMLPLLAGPVPLQAEAQAAAPASIDTPSEVPGAVPDLEEAEGLAC